MSTVQKIHKHWMQFVHILGEINGRIIFTILYFTVLGLFAVPLKLLSLLRKKNNKNQNSFWLEKEYQKPTLDLLKRQF